jgi:ribosomal protein S18 acetylase RimI-like enzyme
MTWRRYSSSGNPTIRVTGVTEMLPRVVDVDTERMAEAAEVFVDAFQDDPWARHLFRGSDPSFDRSVRNLYRALLEVRSVADEPVLGVEVDGALVGVATIEPPDHVTGLLDSARSPSSLRAMTALFTRAGPAAIRRLMAYSSAVSGQRPGEPHYYLHGLAVLRRAQGRGHARLLLDATHEIVEADPSAVGIALDTDTPENVSLYRHFGYETTAVVDAGGFTMSCMLRRSPGRLAG